MAYNPIFPVNYQPMNYGQVPMPQQAQQQNNGSIIWVQGMESAKSYLVAPNTTVILFDTERETIYLKSADASGMPSIKILDYSIRNDSPQEPMRASHSEFAMKSDVESIKKDIEALTSRVNLMAEKGGEING